MERTSAKRQGHLQIAPYINQHEEIDHEAACPGGTISRLHEQILCAYPAQMRITDQALEEFIQLYAEEFGETLSDDKAREVASNLLGFYLLFAQPTPKEQAAMGETKP